MKSFAGTVFTLALLGVASAFPSLNSSSDDYSAFCLSNPDIRLTKENEVSFNVVLFSAERGFFCSGVILNSRWVLTAASCLKNQSFAVIAGVHDSDELNAINDINETTKPYLQIRTIKSDEHYIIHELYDDGFAIANLALIYLEEALDIDSFPEVKPVNAPIGDDESLEGKGVVYGWGHIPGSQIPAQLFAMNTTIHGYDACSTVDSTFLPTHICTRNVADLCAEGSGAPMMRTMSDGKQFLVGLSSWEGSMCHDRKPLYYTNLVVFKDWIAETATNYEEALRIREVLFVPLPEEESDLDP